MVGRYSIPELMTRGQPRWLPGIQAELMQLESQADPDRLRQVLAEHLPAGETNWFARGLESLRPTASRWDRLAARRQWARWLAPYAVRPPMLSRLAAAAEWAGARVHPRRRVRPGLAEGGIVVALLGGDGAGKLDLCPLAPPVAFPLAPRPLGPPGEAATVPAHRARRRRPQDVPRPRGSGRSRRAARDAAASLHRA